MAPAVLKSCLTAHDISSVALDLNREFIDIVNDHPSKNQIQQFLIYETLNKDLIPEICKIFDQLAKRVLDYNPEWVALSLLTYLCQNTTKWLCLTLKSHCPNLKIVIGGPGCFSSLKGNDSFAVQLKSQGVIDAYVVGDGEQAIVEVIQGNNNYPGVNNNDWKEIQNLDDLPFPDFDDYQWHLYSEKTLAIWGSRGCVRECTFCDIHEHWEKFNWRSAENIFQEMLYQNEKYKINRFHFADSLVNGNQKEYRKLIKLLADFNCAKPVDQQIKWGGFFIFRNQDQMREEDWKLTADSGVQVLIVGVESFVEHIRYHVKKKFSNQDLDYGLDMCKKYNINVGLLTIVGYATETHQDHVEQLKWLETHTRYAKNPIKHIEFGQGLAILPGTWLDKNSKSLDIQIVDDKVYQNWTSARINSTPEIRNQRLQEIRKHATQLGFRVVKATNNHKIIHDYLTNKTN
jgi:radical SAM superfamily enzyme YgiQ (UPF0313 family)